MGVKFSGGVSYVIMGGRWENRWKNLLSAVIDIEASHSK